MATDIVVTVLGEVGTRVDGVAVDLGGTGQRCLLGALAVDPYTNVSAEALIDRLWNGDVLPSCTR